MELNALLLGDSIEVMQSRVDDETIDLIYLDPPTAGARDFRLVQGGIDATLAPGLAPSGRFQEELFAAAPERAIETNARLASTEKVIQALRAVTQQANATYFTQLATCLLECHRVLRPSGSIWVHVTPSVSHYFALLLDAVFGHDQLRSTVVWQHPTLFSKAGGMREVTDSILYYSKSRQHHARSVFVNERESVRRYRDQEGRAFTLETLSAPGHGTPRVFAGRDIPPPEGRRWRHPQKSIDQLELEGRIYFAANGAPYLKRFDGEGGRSAVTNLWTDVVPARGPKERLRFPGQKPVALLERVVMLSTEPGDIVLDPFCGSGSTLVAANELGRDWIGIDAAPAAIAVSRARLSELSSRSEIRLVDEPDSLRELEDRIHGPEGYEWFHWWALGKIGAIPELLGSRREADALDGFIRFDGAGGEEEQAGVEVKAAGRASVSDLRNLVVSIERGRIPIGILVSLREPTDAMRREAAAAGSYHSPIRRRDFPRLQVLSAADLLEGRRGLVPAFTPPMFKPGRQLVLE